MTTLNGYSETEQRDLMAAIHRNCACELQEDTIVTKCESCAMTDSKRTTDGLLFMRRNQVLLKIGEGLG